MKRQLVTCLFLVVPNLGDAQEQASVPKNEVLERFVGVWDLKSTLKRAKWNTDGAETTGKVFFDMEITATRQTAAGGNVPKATDQSRLQGTWGAVTYVQNCQEGPANTCLDPAPSSQSRRTALENHGE